MNVVAQNLTRKAMKTFTSRKAEIIAQKGEEYYDDVVTRFNELLDVLDVVDQPDKPVVTLKPTDQVIKVNAISNENGF